MQQVTLNSFSSCLYASQMHSSLMWFSVVILALPINKRCHTRSQKICINMGGKGEKKKHCSIALSFCSVMAYEVASNSWILPTDFLPLIDHFVKGDTKKVRGHLWDDGRYKWLGQREVDVKAPYSTALLEHISNTNSSWENVLIDTWMTGGFFRVWRCKS